jgi:8-oxo-dGTP diphosphatase
MKQTSLCYLYREEKVLMMHRIKKKNDLNEGMWIGIGGHFEENESPEECALREIREETGLTATEYRYRGIVTFVSDRYEGEHMHLFTVTATEGELKADCDEGVLQWLTKEEFAALPQWEGDKIFLALLEQDVPFFSLKLEYEGSSLKAAALNGRPLPLK